MLSNIQQQKLRATYSQRIVICSIAIAQGIIIKLRYFCKPMQDLWI